MSSRREFLAGSPNDCRSRPACNGFGSSTGWNGIHYNDHFNLRLTGQVNGGPSSGPLAGIVRRHGAMQAAFSEVDGAYSERFSPAQPTGVPRGSPKLPEQVGWPRPCGGSQGGRTPFNLSQGPLWRFYSAWRMTIICC